MMRLQARGCLKRNSANRCGDCPHKILNLPSTRPLRKAARMKDFATAKVV